jgi:hypothetical protein
MRAAVRRLRSAVDSQAQLDDGLFGLAEVEKLRDCRYTATQLLQLSFLLRIHVNSSECFGVACVFSANTSFTRS